MKRYKPRAKNVQAVLITESNIEYAGDWCNGRTYSDTKFYSLIFEVNNGENLMVAKPGDYLVKREDGEFIKMTAVEFETIYVEME